jgi:hypothetical protein
MPPITDFTINGFDSSGNKTAFVIVAFFYRSSENELEI